MANVYHVTGQFERSRYHYKVESCTVTSRNLQTAMRDGSKVLLRRPSVKRLRHRRVTFVIEKVVQSVMPGK